MFKTLLINRATEERVKCSSSRDTGTIIVLVGLGGHPLKYSRCAEGDISTLRMTFHRFLHTQILVNATETLQFCTRLVF